MSTRREKILQIAYELQFHNIVNVGRFKDIRDNIQAVNKYLSERLCPEELNLREKVLAAWLIKVVVNASDVYPVETLAMMVSEKDLLNAISLSFEGPEEYLIFKRYNGVYRDDDTWHEIQDKLNEVARRRKISYLGF